MNTNNKHNELPIGWEIYRLEEICDHFKSGNGITSWIISDEGEFPVYGGNGLRGYTESYTHEGNFLLIGRQGALCGNIQKIKGKNYVSEHAIAVQTNDKNNLDFLAYKLDFKNLNRLSESSAQPGLSVEKLVRLKLEIPPLPEQRAIAAILSTWDTAIQSTQALIAQKEQEKKWLMQNLLTGKKRLKGFEKSKDFHKTDLGLKIPIDWTIVKVKEMFKERKETSNDQTEYPLFSLTIEKGLTAKTDRYERSFLLKNKEENLYKLIYPNDILFNPMNLRFGAIAKSKINEIVSVSAYYNSIFSNNNEINIDFYESLFKTPNFINLYDRIAIGSLMEKKRVHLSNFIELEIPFPSIEEQTAIAQVLQTADKEINLLKTKLEQQKLQKKGLMQVLLTGKVRVKN